MRKMILASLVLLMGSAAMADQCAYVTKAQARQAAKILASAERIQSLCEPCGETDAQTVQFADVKVRKTGYENTYEVVLNGQGIDLAYTYADGTNLGLILNCKAQGVSSYLAK
jgi:hypothetical protein